MFKKLKNLLGTDVSKELMELVKEKDLLISRLEAKIDDLAVELNVCKETIKEQESGLKDMNAELDYLTIRINDVEENTNMELEDLRKCSLDELVDRVDELERVDVEQIASEAVENNLPDFDTIADALDCVRDFIKKTDIEFYKNKNVKDLLTMQF